MIRGLITALAFLTRLPTPALDTTDRDLGTAVAFFPLVGLVLAAVLWGEGYLVVGRLPSSMVAVLFVATLAALTGGLHLDGLCDLFDGLGGGRGDRERTLAIMRDSRIGAHGATALILVLLAKVAAVSTLLDRGDFASLSLVPVLARWALVPQMAWFPYARSEGLGRGFKSEARSAHLVIATLIMALVVIGLAALGGINGSGAPSPSPSPWPAGAACAAATGQAGAALLVSLLVALWLRARLGGLTGDVYGATIELCETTALFVAVGWGG